MGLIGRIFVKLGLDNSEFKRGINQSKQQTEGFSAAIKKFGAGLLAAFSIGQVVRFARESVAAYNKQILAITKLEAVLKSTGNAAGLTSRELQKYASDLQKVTMFGDEETLDAMARLATFKSITRDVFKQTIVSAQDLATVLGSDLNGAVMQLGKALEAPEIGLTMLRRSGVSFSTQQIEQIKQLVAEGKKQEAQLVMLTEIQSQFGGAAVAAGDTAAGSMKKLGNAFGDLREDLGALSEDFKPVIDELTKLIGYTRIYLAFRRVITKKGRNQIAQKEADKEFAAQQMQYVKSVEDAEKKLKMAEKGKGNRWRVFAESLRMYIRENKKAVDLEYESIGAIERRIDLIKQEMKEVAPKDLPYLKERLQIEEAKLAALTGEVEVRKTGLIPVLEEEIKRRKEILADEKDPEKIRAINDEIALAEKKLAIAKMTTAELKEYKKQLRQTTDPTLMGSKDITGGKSFQNIAFESKAEREARLAMKTKQSVNTSGLDKTIEQQTKNNKAAGEEALRVMEEQQRRAEEIANAFGQTVAMSIADSIGVLADALMNVGKLDSSSLVNALLVPFADMAVQMGQIMIATGVAAIATKAIGAVGGGAGAIAAGVALVALGQVAKAGLTAAANKSFGGGQSETNSSFVGGQGGLDLSTAQRTPLVLEGILKGEDIYLSNKKAAEKRAR